MEELETPTGYLIRAVALAEEDLEEASEEECEEIVEAMEFFQILSYITEEGFVAAEFDVEGELRFYPL